MQAIVDDDNDDDDDDVDDDDDDNIKLLQKQPYWSLHTYCEKC